MNGMLIVFRNVVCALCALFGTTYLIKRYKFNINFQKLKKIRDDYQKEKVHKIKSFGKHLYENVLTFDEIENVTNKDIEELKEYIEKNDPLKVILTYQMKAYQINEKLNCINQFFDVDIKTKRTGPLAGIPFSIKDNYQLKGYYSYVGCSELLQSKSDVNSVLVDVLINLGAIPFVKTNTPQTMMSFLSSNPIDGIVLNPINQLKSPGGSSSGEAALIGASSSLFGLGTDIGGSVRLPAALCGVVGFKPGIYRLSKEKLLSVCKTPLVEGACGILGRDVGTITYVFREIVNSPLHYQLDPIIPPLHFNDSLNEWSVEMKVKKKRRIGYFIYDGSYRAVPAVERAVLECAEIMKMKGHEVVLWQPPLKGYDWLRMFLSGLSVDKGRDLRKLCEYDIKDRSVQHMLTLFSYSWLKIQFIKMIAYLKGNKDGLLWLNVTQKFNKSSEIIDLQDEIYQFRKTLIDDWKKNKLDAVICPMAGFGSIPVQPIKGSMTGMMTYLNLWNLVDFPAGTVPFTKITVEDEKQLHLKYPRNKSLWHYNTFKSQENSVDMPISVQVVSLPWQEELCLNIMHQIEKSKK